jgi:hydrogenase maturation protease
MERHPHSHRLVIGIGNPLRGDDGVGALLAEQAAVLTAADRGGSVAVRSVQQLTPELAAELAHLDAVLFIDAWSAPAEALPLLLPLHLAGVPCDVTHFDSHRLQPAALLAVCQVLYGRVPDAQVLLVPAHALEHGTTLSAELRAVLPQARALLRQWLSGGA